MRKHFRNKHAGLEMQVTTHRDDEMDRRVEEILADCSVPLWKTSDPDLLAWCPPAAVQPQQQQRHNGHRSSKIGWKTSSGEASGDGGDDDGNGEEVSENRNVSAAGGQCKASSGSDSTIHRCPNCPYTSDNVKLLRGHMVMHTEYRLKCAYCDYHGPYPSRIRKHWRRLHQKNGLPFKMDRDDGVEPVDVSEEPKPQSASSSAGSEAMTPSRTRDVRDMLKTVTEKSTVAGKCAFCSQGGVVWHWWVEDY
jgi:hypothetical protein